MRPTEKDGKAGIRVGEPWREESHAGAERTGATTCTGALPGNTFAAASGQTEYRFGRLAAELQRWLRLLSRARPWRGGLQVSLPETGDPGGLTAWIVADNALHAVWASSVHGNVHRVATVVSPGISRIVITARRMN